METKERFKKMEHIKNISTGTSSKEYKLKQLAELVNAKNKKQNETKEQKIKNLLSELPLQPKNSEWNLDKEVTKDLGLKYNVVMSGFFDYIKLAKDYFVVTFSGIDYYLICYGLCYKLKITK